MADAEPEGRSRGPSTEDRPSEASVRQPDGRAGGWPVRAGAPAPGGATDAPRPFVGRYLQPLVFGLALFLLALVPRWLGSDVFVTSDEDSWMRRGGGFAYGMSHGLFGRTYQNGHPGVLTMELAILGQGPGGAERFADPVTGAPLVTKVPGFFEALVDARRAFVLVGASMVALLGLLVWRLWGPGPALVAGLLLAFDPFLVAHSQLVHTDGLLAGLTAAAAMCGLVRWAANGGRGWVLAGGALSGLALLAKVPAIYLAAYIPLLALALRRRRVFGDLALWAVAGFVTIVALWPSLWVNPLSTVTRMIEFTRETGGQPDEVGSFLLGRAWSDPGPLFYPVALAFRLTPAEAVGLIALAALGWPMRRLLRGRWSVTLGLLGYAVGFLLFVTLAPKKFDRYALPLMPALLVLAGLGLWLGFRRLRPFMAGGPPAVAAVACLLGLLFAQASALASVSPYYMAYFNPLLGGGAVASQAVMVGNGEGMDQVADYFNRLPDAGQLWVASHSFDLLAAKCRCDGEPLRERAPANADYLVTYGRRIQLHRWGASLEEYFQAHEPIHRVWINGIEMARIYRGPRS
jgi:hypothetical protein